MGLRGGIFSLTTFNMPKIGTLRNIPGIPQANPPKIIEIIVKKGLTATRPPVIVGVRMLFSKIWIIMKSIMTPMASEGFGEMRVYNSGTAPRSEEHTSELQSRENLVCRLLLEKKKYRI